MVYVQLIAILDISTTQLAEIVNSAVEPITIVHLATRLLALNVPQTIL